MSDNYRRPFRYFHLAESTFLPKWVHRQNDLQILDEDMVVYRPKRFANLSSLLNTLALDMSEVNLTFIKHLFLP
jgi:hypothetical protein